MTRYVDFIREWAQKHDKSYMCAATDPRAREEYYGVYPKRPTKSKLKQMREDAVMGLMDMGTKAKESAAAKDEAMSMGGEDINRAAIKVKVKKPKAVAAAKGKPKKNVIKELSPLKQYDDWWAGALDDPTENSRNEETDPEWIAKHPFGLAPFSVRLNDQFMFHYISADAEKKFKDQKEEVLNGLNSKYGTNIVTGSFENPDNINAMKSFQSWRSDIEDLSLKELYPPKPSKAELKAKEKETKAELKAKEKEAKKSAAKPAAAKDNKNRQILREWFDKLFSDKSLLNVDGDLFFDSGSAEVFVSKKTKSGRGAVSANEIIEFVSNQTKPFTQENVFKKLGSDERYFIDDLLSGKKLRVMDRYENNYRMITGPKTDVPYKRN